MSFNATQFLKTVSTQPGVYQMLNAKNEVIYVGKAKNLRKRLQSYFRQQLDSDKTKLMMSKVASVRTTVTHTENEALILENNLIKELAPRYNIFMRDDKTYPYIVVSQHKKFPRLSSYRGKKRNRLRYFGPFPNVAAVKETLYTLQKLFRIRSCTDSYFNHRTRPCLQYQIKRCSAPCVDFISESAYQAELSKTILFLKGKNKELIKTLTTQMQLAAEDLHYEQAAELRDKINKLNYIQQQQFVMCDDGDFDVIAIQQKWEHTSIVLLQVRDGKLLGNQDFLVKTALAEDVSQTLHAFLSRFYLAAVTIPHSILTNVIPKDKAWLMSALSEHVSYKVDIIQPLRGAKKRWVDLANSNVEQSLYAYLQRKLSPQKRLVALAEVLQLPVTPVSMECFDISHHRGEATVAACVAFNQQGPAKSEYRRFNINGVTPGDDYAALREAIQRHYTAKLKSKAQLPDILVIDGGRGQLQQAVAVFTKLNIDSVQLLSISKGTGRNPDFDVLWLPQRKEPLTLSANSMALHVVQQLRDEAHRFAITGHKQRIRKERRRSILESIDGIGVKRRQKLLKTFGGIQGIRNASITDIANVSGINKLLAQQIYVTLKDSTQ